MILGPCFECGLSAMDALKEAEENINKLATQCVDIQMKYDYQNKLLEHQMGLLDKVREVLNNITANLSGEAYQLAHQQAKAILNELERLKGRT